MSKVKIFVLFSLVMAIVLASSDTVEHRRVPEQNLAKFEDNSIESGDVIFRRGRGFWSPYFSTLNSQTTFSHVGVVIEVSSRSWVVIHAEAEDDGSDGFVKITELGKFIDESETYQIKSNKMNSHQKKLFIASMFQYFEKSVPFDSSFSLDDGGRQVYCTELVWLAGKSAGIETLGLITRMGGRDIITVDSIYQSRLLAAR